jgi:hypothetical protein
MAELAQAVGARRTRAPTTAPGREAPVFDPPQELEQLDSELRALGDRAMMIEELDGYGLLVCPA